MRYLVTFDGVDVGPLLPPQQVAGLMRTVVIPTEEALARLETEGKVHGVSRPGPGRARSSWMPSLTMRPTRSCRGCQLGALRSGS